MGPITTENPFPCRQVWVRSSSPWEVAVFYRRLRVHLRAASQVRQVSSRPNLQHAGHTTDAALDRSGTQSPGTAPGPRSPRRMARAARSGGRHNQRRGPTAAPRQHGAPHPAPRRHNRRRHNTTGTETHVSGQAPDEPLCPQTHCGAGGVRRTALGALAARRPVTH